MQLLPESLESHPKKGPLLPTPSPHPGTPRYDVGVDPPEGPVYYYSPERVMFARRKHTRNKRIEKKKRKKDPPRHAVLQTPLRNSAGPAYRTEENCGEAGGRSR